MKYLHIITVGTSVLRNYLNNKENTLSSIQNSPSSDPDQIEELKTFLKEDPKKNSAEINSLYTFLWDRFKIEMISEESIENHSVYLVHTLTPEGELCKTVLERFLKEKGFSIYGDREIELAKIGLEPLKEGDSKAFFEGMRKLFKDLFRLIQTAKEKKYQVFINVTGGMKAHVIVSAFGGLLTGVELYYLHEDFKQGKVIQFTFVDLLSIY